MEVLIGFVWVVLSMLFLFGGASFLLVGVPYALIYVLPALIVRVRLHGFGRIRRSMDELSKAEVAACANEGKVPPRIEGPLKERMLMLAEIHALDKVVDAAKEFCEANAQNAEAPKEKRSMEREKRKAQMRKDYGFSNDADLERILTMMEAAEAEKGDAQ